MAEIKSDKKYSPLEDLAFLRDTISDEIPKEIVHSDSGVQTKARRNWFQGIVGDVENALERHLIKVPEKIDIILGRVK